MKPKKKRRRQNDRSISVSGKFYRRVTEGAPRLKSDKRIRPGWLSGRLNLAINRALDDAERTQVTSA
jgi:hypothetical protein